MTPKTLRRGWVTGASAIALLFAYSPAVGASALAGEVGAPHLDVWSCTPASIVAQWSIDRLIEQLIVIPVDQTALSQTATEVTAGVGGILLTGSAPADLKDQISKALKAAPEGIAPFVMTDEEGGAVQRLWPLIANVPSARTMGATMAPAAIEHLASRLARSMRGLGLTMDLAPVADVDARPGPDAANADGTRSFSGHPAKASRDALAFAAGLESGGVIPVVKHFPGLGGTLGNTDLVSASTPPWQRVERSGLVPFKQAIAADIPAIMISNATVPGLSRLPASLSRVVITGELRGRLHFRGLILTDSLSVGAITQAQYSLGAAVVGALSAGADMVLFNATTAGLASTTAEIVGAVRSAVVKGALARLQIVRAAALVLAAKHLTRC